MLVRVAILNALALARLVFLNRGVRSVGYCSRYVELERK